ncbi:hypothetical protein [Luteitalea sp.]
MPTPERCHVGRRLSEESFEHDIQCAECGCHRPVDVAALALTLETEVLPGLTAGAQVWQAQRAERWVRHAIASYWQRAGHRALAAPLPAAPVREIGRSPDQQFREEYGFGPQATQGEG